MEYLTTVSVRNLVEFILRRGDIDRAEAASASDMVLGTKIHRMIQKQEEKCGGYRSEVRLSDVFTFGDISVKVQGIADGIIERDGLPVIDEIKSTSYPIDEIDDDFSYLHRAQADFYGYFYCAQNSIEEIITRLTYVDAETKAVRKIEKKRTYEELKKFTYEVCEKYAKWAKMQAEHIKRRDRSISSFGFPYESFRKGQREMAAHIYSAITNRQTLFAQAPTGIGKTVSAVFPALKTLGEHKTEKIFYLTSKNTTKIAAQKLFSMMKDKGLCVKSVSITAKDKLCPYEKQCTPARCPFAAGHFDRINDAVFDLVTSESLITPEIIEKYAKKHNVCPFEFSLDVSEWCDVVICDCNYAFDPRASLKRYFEAGGEYVLLCDEAHNLVDRGREMFSASISKNNVLSAARSLRSVSPKSEKALKKMNKQLLEYRKKSEEDGNENFLTEIPNDFYFSVRAFCEAFSEFLSEKGHDEEKSAVSELFFDALYFVSVYDNLDDDYSVFVKNESKDTVLSLFCTDPSRLLSETRKKCRSVIYFSATLLPKEYYENMICGKYDENRRFIRLPSPFPRENLMISIFSSLSTRYKDRDNSLASVAELINASTKHPGNYFIFFPSFQYMEKAQERFTSLFPNVRTVIQSRNMTAEERDAFLDEFCENPQKTLIGFAVCGGVFSEGIDLVGTRLSGVLVIGTGLPQVCFENDLIRDHFDQTDSKGFLYAYEYPGFNRVLQAAGRVIRSETDQGFVVLVDDRYAKEEYRSLFPPEWFSDDFEYIYSIKALENKINHFFNK